MRRDTGSSFFAAQKSGRKNGKVLGVPYVREEVFDTSLSVRRSGVLENIRLENLCADGVLYLSYMTLRGRMSLMTRSECCFDVHRETILAMLIDSMARSSFLCISTFPFNVRYMR